MSLGDLKHEVLAGFPALFLNTLLYHEKVATHKILSSIPLASSSDEETDILSSKLIIYHQGVGL